MPRVVLATVNAKYIHAAFGLRYLAANMGDLASETQICEFTLSERPIDIVERIVALRPAVVGLGVYIWNCDATRQIVALMRRVAPEVKLVVGGPEVSYEIESQAWLSEVDYIVKGEGDRAFPELCARLLEGKRPLTRIIDGGQPELAELRLPYHLYDEGDLAHRILYVEASRGCPYRCEFCLSSLDKTVRAFELEPLLEAFDALIGRGARQFKFVDRTFNLDLGRSAAILEFFLARIDRGLSLHFEMVPDRLPDGLRELIARFPPGTMQFEVGIQSLDDEVGRRIQRRQNIERSLDNLAFLREKTGVHVHTDLIIGLPGESIESFGEGLDRLVRAGVQEVQVGVLKRLRGTPISRHSEAFEMRYEPHPPYSILSNSLIDFATMQRLKRFALVWDRFWNQGDFRSTMLELWGDASPFWTTLEFCDWLHARAGRVHAIALARRGRFLVDYLVETRGGPRERVEAQVQADLAAAGRFAKKKEKKSGGFERQQRHLDAGSHS